MAVAVMVEVEMRTRGFSAIWDLLDHVFHDPSLLGFILSLRPP